MKLPAAVTGSPCGLEQRSSLNLLGLHASSKAEVMNPSCQMAGVSESGEIETRESSQSASLSFQRQCQRISVKVSRNTQIIGLQQMQFDGDLDLV